MDSEPNKAPVQAASGEKYATLTYGSTYRVMGVVFERGVSKKVSGKVLDYVSGLEYEITVGSEDDGYKIEKRKRFTISDGPVEARRSAPRRARRA